MSERNIIRISADGKIEKLEYPNGTCNQQNKRFCEMIGDCDIYEAVYPARLYTVFGSIRSPYECKKFPHGMSKALMMLVDEEFFYKDPNPSINRMASWLYEMDIHGQPILGNALIVGVKRDRNGEVDMCPIDPDYCDQLVKEFTCFADTVFN